MNRTNQQHPPSSKQKRVDAQGNDRKKLMTKLKTKNSSATMIIASGATEACYNHAWAKFVSVIEAGGGHVVCDIKSIQ